MGAGLRLGFSRVAFDKHAHVHTYVYVYAWFYLIRMRRGRSNRVGAGGDHVALFTYSRILVGSVVWLVNVIISYQKDTCKVCKWSVQPPSRRFTMQCSPTENGCAPRATPQVLYLFPYHLNRESWAKPPDKRTIHASQLHS